MWRKVKVAFVSLAVFVFAGLIFRGEPTQSPGQAIAGLVIFGISLLILMGLVSSWGWLKRQLFKKDDEAISTDAVATRPPGDASRKRGN